MTLPEEIALIKIKAIENTQAFLKKEVNSLYFRINEKLLEKGEKGDTGENGKDGLNGKDGTNGKDGKKGVNGKDGKDGKDAVLDTKKIEKLIPSTEEITNEVVAIIKKKKLLEIQDIKNGLNSTYNKKKGDLNDPTRGPLDQRWHGSGSKNTILGETPSGLINGVNKVFNLSKAPNPINSLVLILNGQVLTRDIDFTLSGTTIIMTVAPQNIPDLVLRAIYYEYI